MSQVKVNSSVDAEGQPLSRQLRNVDHVTKITEASHASAEPSSNCSTLLDYIHHIFRQACEYTEPVTNCDLMCSLALLTSALNSGFLEAGRPQVAQYQAHPFQLVIQVGNMRITGHP